MSVNKIGRKDFLLGVTSLGVSQCGLTTGREQAGVMGLTLARTLSVEHDVDVFLAGGGPARRSGLRSARKC